MAASAATQPTRSCDRRRRLSSSRQPGRDRQVQPERRHGPPPRGSAPCAVARSQPAVARRRLRTPVRRAPARRRRAVGRPRRNREGAPRARAVPGGGLRSPMEHRDDQSRCRPVLRRRSSRPAAAADQPGAAGTGPARARSPGRQPGRRARGVPLPNHASACHCSRRRAHRALRGAAGARLPGRDEPTDRVRRRDPDDHSRRRTRTAAVLDHHHVRHSDGHHAGRGRNRVVLPGGRGERRLLHEVRR